MPCDEHNSFHNTNTYRIHWPLVISYIYWESDQQHIEIEYFYNCSTLRVLTNWSARCDPDHSQKDTLRRTCAVLQLITHTTAMCLCHVSHRQPIAHHRSWASWSSLSWEQYETNRSVMSCVSSLFSFLLPFRFTLVQIICAYKRIHTTLIRLSTEVDRISHMYRCTGVAQSCSSRW